MSPTCLVCLYGYSLVLFVPVAVLCLVPSDGARWAVVLVGGLVGALCLVLNLRAVLTEWEDTRRRGLLLAATGAAHVGLALALKLYFFQWSA